MSLLSEAVATVMQSEATTSTNLVLPPTLTPPLESGFYKQLIGVVEPRGLLTTSVVIDVETGQPLKFPPNAIPMYAFFVPIEPLISGNLGTTTIALYLLKTPENKVDTFYYYYANLSDTNGNFILELCDVKAEGLTEYFYPAISVNTGPPVTSGLMKIIFQYV